MKLSLRPVIAGASVLAITGGVLAASVGTAFAATPPWQPESASQSLGTLTFYDASGNVVTSGNNLGHLFAYAKASTADAATGLKATLEFAIPEHASAAFPDPGTWPVAADTGEAATSQPAAGLPAPISNATPVVNTNNASGGDVGTFISSQSFDPTAGYNDMVEVRVVTAGGGGGSNAAGQWWETDISVNPAAGTWTQAFPAVLTSTNTNLVDTANPSITGASVNMQATVTPAGTAGSVDFTDVTTSSDFGNGAYNAATGVATLSHTFAAATAGDTIKATFTPADPTSFSGSNGTTVQVVNPPATPTTTTLGVTQDGTAGHDVLLTSTVSPAAAAGSVSFYDNGSASPLDPTPVPWTGGPNVTFDIPAGLAAGGHSIVAKFTPTNPANFQASQSQPNAFFLSTPTTGPCSQPGSTCTDTQTIQTEVPVGTLIINTPYTATNPLDLGPMTLNGTGTEFNVSGGFKCITIADTTAGALPWTAQALASNLVDQNPPSGATVTQISAQNVGLTNFNRPVAPADAPTCSDTQSYTGTVATADNAAAEPAVAPAAPGTAGLGGTTSHTFATGTGGDGVTTLDGTLTINAPANTAAGTYRGTITFTVSD
jgi:hypothetical protein